MFRRQSGTARERRFELRDVGAVNEFTAGFAARDDLFRVGKDSRAIARDGGQHRVSMPPAARCLQSLRACGARSRADPCG